MLPKSGRLSTREVEKVLTQGHFSRSGALDMKYIKAEGPFRASAVVSKSTTKLAVNRNRVRRALYRALRHFQYTQGVWALFFVRRIPKEKLVPLFVEELKVLLKNFPQNK